MELTGERVIMRIFIGERDKFQGKPLYEAEEKRPVDLEHDHAPWDGRPPWFRWIE